MLPIQFFGQNLHFSLNLFFSLATFATFWLYFDAWLVSKKPGEVLKWLGFLLVSISFLFQGVLVEKEILGASILGDYSDTTSLLLRAVAYILIIIALINEPLQKVPKNEGLNLTRNAKALVPLSISGISKIFLPFGALLIAFLYFRKATEGMEKHLRQVAVVFLALAVSEVFALAVFFRGSSNINIAKLTAAFGPLWTLQQVFLLIATVVLAVWVWSYLIKRLLNQLFIIFTSTILVIFLLISVSLTFLLVKNIEENTLANLTTASKVLNLSLDSKKVELFSQAEVFSLNPDIKAAVVSKNHSRLVELLEESTKNKQITGVVITSDSGMVLARAEDPDRWGDALSGDLLVKKALSGQAQTSVVAKEGVLAPIISLQAAQPITENGKVVGAVVVGLSISNNFLDGIKSSTGLDSAIYAGNTRSATTLLAPDGKSRWVGIKEEDTRIKAEVLEKGKTFQGNLNLVNRPFLAVYQPIHNSNEEVVGMLFTGQPETLILKASGRSIELVFLLAAVLLLVAIVPAYLISKYIAYQLR